MNAFTDLPETADRVFGAIYIAKWGNAWFILQVTNASDRSVSPIAGPYDHCPDIALSVQPVCPNCGQFVRQGDCLNECHKRGLA